jgi:hypothetical protein
VTTWWVGQHSTQPSVEWRAAGVLLRSCQLPKAGHVWAVWGVVQQEGIVVAEVARLSSSASKSLGSIVPLPSSYSAHRSTNSSRFSGRSFQRCR